MKPLYKLNLKKQNETKYEKFFESDLGPQDCSSERLVHLVGTVTDSVYDNVEVGFGTILTKKRFTITQILIDINIHPWMYLLINIHGYVSGKFRDDTRSHSLFIVEPSWHY